MFASLTLRELKPGPPAPAIVGSARSSSADATLVVPPEGTGGERPHRSPWSSRSTKECGMEEIWWTVRCVSEFGWEVQRWKRVHTHPATLECSSSMVLEM